MRKTIGIFTLLLAIFLLTGLLESNLFSKKSYFFDSGNVFNMAKWPGLFGILAVGVCFVKNDTPNIIGRMNHHNLEFVFKAKIKHKTAIADK